MSIVVTVSRQLGSRGSYIATAVAKSLGLRYIDREILNRAAEIAGYPDEEMVAQLENKEKVPGALDRFFQAMNSLPMIPTIASATLREGYTYDEQIALLMLQEDLNRDEAQARRQQEYSRKVEAGTMYSELIRRVIQEYAHIGDVIIVGRGGQVVLRDFPHAFHVRVQADKALRIQRLIERLGLDFKEAEREINQSDKERTRYLKYYYDADWADPSLYHLIINTGKLSVDLITHLICEAVKQSSQQP